MKINELRKKYYYVKNFFTLNSHLIIKDSNIKYAINEPSIVESFLDKKYFSRSTNNSIKIIISKLVSKNDVYSIDINFQKEIIIKASTTAAFIYATDLLNDLVEKDKEGIALPIVHIDDCPSFKMRGIIEGFYGTPWTHENHLDMIEYMRFHRLNTYMYAPKMDRYHRDKWYEPYPKEDILKFKELVAKMNSYGMDFYYCISPGHAPEGEKGFEYTGDDDFNRLFRKLDQFIKIGVTNFGLLLDDIDYKLTGENLEKFKRPGIAHAYICNRVYDYLSERVKNLKFIMCPTEYHEIGETPYRNDLKHELHKDILVFWTGDNVCAELISDKATIITKEAFGNKLVLWDNFPVTDFTYGVRQFMAPLINRSAGLGKLVDGYLINPMKEYEISKVGMTTACHYAWNSQKYNEDLSFNISLHEIGPLFYQKGWKYILFNLPNILTYGNIEEERKMVENKEYDKIINYYKEVSYSARSLLNLTYPIIDELAPWLKRALKEAKVAEKIIDNTIEKKELLSFLKDIHFNGSELIDLLIKQTNLLTDEEYNELITKRRGRPWYRIYEYKRYGGNLC